MITTVTIPDVILAAEILLVLAATVVAYTYLLKEVKRLRGRLDGTESEVHRLRAEVNTGDER